MSGMERNIAILVGSVPALNQLVPPAAKLFQRIRSWSRMRLESTKSQSYQLSDFPDSGQPHHSGNNPQQTRGNSRETGLPVSDRSVDYILPVQGRETL